ncbi:MAG: trypsin-like peptidase domain-containing protein [Phycisphaerae bacterium]
MLSKSLHLAVVTTLALTAGLNTCAMAVIIDDGGTGSSNTTAPDGFPYWDNIFQDADGTGVYLGNRWVLTAWHVNANSVVIQGTQYSVVPGTVLQMTNSNGTTADMVVFRINGDPGLPSIPIATASPPSGTAVTMIGDGRDRMPDQLYWDANFNPATKQHYAYSGFQWAATSRSVRWGDNTIVDIGQPIDEPNWGNTTISFSTRFWQYAGYCQAASGDSGGAVFVGSGTNWSLAGMMFSISGFYRSGQPTDTAVFDNKTWSADLAAYRTQLTPIEGDANNNGIVDMTDYTIWFGNYGRTDAGWRQGDFNGDNLVDMADYILWFTNFGTSINAAGAGSFSAPEFYGVPEPATLALLAAGALLLKRRRR